MCSWGHDAPDGLVCIAAAPEGGVGATLPRESVGCAFWEAPAHCDPCGACCREAFDSVPVSPEDEPVAIRYPELVRVHSDGWRDLARVPTPTGTKCTCLRGDGGDNDPYRCTIYADRPTNCRELAPGSANCLLARRRVGLSPRVRAPGR